MTLQAVFVALFFAIPLGTVAALHLLFEADDPRPAVLS